MLFWLPVQTLPPYVARAEKTTIQYGEFEIHTNPKATGDCVVVERKGKAIWTGVPNRWHPWRTLVGDLDHDGHPELIFALYKSTHFRPDLHDCLFVYTIQTKSVKKRWLGSWLGRKFSDASMMPDGTLITIQTKLDGKLCLTGQRWIGFGFKKVWERGNWKEARITKVSNGQVEVKTDKGSEVIPVGK